MDIWSLSSIPHRDLWWLLSTPTIVEDKEGRSWTHAEKQTWLPRAWEWLQRDAEYPENLAQWVSNPHRRRKLGLYAEDLIHYYLQWGSPWHVRAHDIQIQEDRRSIGALDFILEREGQIEHWEMTVKFYLQHRPTGAWQDWIGADERDSLEKKWAHFHTKQLLLTQHPATHQRLHDLGIPPPQRSRIWHCGMLFSEWNAPCTLPTPRTWGEMHPLQPMGHWIRRRDFIQQFFSSRFRWVIRPHPHWLAPIESEDAMSTLEIMDQPLERGFLMLAQMEASQNGWREMARWVLVYDQWGEGIQRDSLLTRSV